MGRYSASDENSFASGVVTPSADMPITGVFGSGRVAYITASQNFVIPATSLRVRMWGCGGKGATMGGGGGGFALKIINGLTIGDTVVATLGITGGSATSFGAYVSATGGADATSTVLGVGGMGVGGDINNRGGQGGSGNGTSLAGGGGVANALGKGGEGGSGGSGAGKSASSGGGAGYSAAGGVAGIPGSGIAPVGSSSLDFIGCGSGMPSGSGTQTGIAYPNSPQLPNTGNGGGGSGMSGGAFPGGGGGGSNEGAGPLMVVEW